MPEEKIIYRSKSNITYELKLVEGNWILKAYINGVEIDDKILRLNKLQRIILV